MAKHEWSVLQVGSSLPEKGRETLKPELERLTNGGWEIFSVNGPHSGGLYEILAHKPD
jgi:hypothetical protein